VLVQAPVNPKNVLQLSVLMVKLGASATKI
jgi:hypothetical protein